MSPGKIMTPFPLSPWKRRHLPAQDQGNAKGFGAPFSLALAVERAGSNIQELKQERGLHLQVSLPWWAARHPVLELLQEAQSASAELELAQA